MSAQQYKHLPVVVGADGTSGETQHYVTRDFVTKEQIISGDDNGVICLCFSSDMAEGIVRLLNNHHTAGGRV